MSDIDFFVWVDDVDAFLDVNMDDPTRPRFCQMNYNNNQGQNIQGRLIACKIGTRTKYQGFRCILSKEETIKERAEKIL
jgi:hypothetical protein